MYRLPSLPAASCLSATRPCDNHQLRKTILKMVSWLERYTRESILTLTVRPKLRGYPDPARRKPVQPTITSAVAHMVHRPSVKLRRLSSKVCRGHRELLAALANSKQQENVKQTEYIRPKHRSNQPRPHQARKGRPKRSAKGNR